MICDIILSNDTSSIPVPVVVNDECSFDLVVDEQDVKHMCLEPLTNSVTQSVAARPQGDDGSSKAPQMITYHKLNLSIKTTDGSVVSTTVTPVSFPVVVAAAGRKKGYQYITTQERIIGQSTLRRLELEQDYESRLLTRNLWEQGRRIWG